MQFMDPLGRLIGDSTFVTITDTRPLPEPFEPSIPRAYRIHWRGRNKVARRKGREGVLDQVIYRAAWRDGRPIRTIHDPADAGEGGTDGR